MSLTPLLLQDVFSISMSNPELFFFSLRAFAQAHIKHLVLDELRKSTTASCIGWFEPRHVKFPKATPEYLVSRSTTIFIELPRPRTKPIRSMYLLQVLFRKCVEWRAESLGSRKKDWSTVDAPCHTLDQINGVIEGLLLPSWWWVRTTWLHCDRADSGIGRAENLVGNWLH